MYTRKDFTASLALAVVFVLKGDSVLGGTLQSLVVSTVQPSSATCAAPPSSSSFATPGGNIYEYFEELNLNAGDAVGVRWVGPNGQLVSTISWNPLSRAGSYCFTGGYLPSSQFSPLPGPWQLQVYVNGQYAGQIPFNITGSSGTSSVPGAPVLTGLGRSEVNVGTIPLTTFGNNFIAGALINVDYIPDGHRVGSVATQVLTAQKLTGNLSIIFPGEYRLTVQNPNGSVSNPQTLFVGLSGYKLPFAQGQSWQTTQGNDEAGSGFDHHGTIAYAYDFSDGPNLRVVAMKAGIVHTHDQGISGPRVNSDGSCVSGVEYGNYITIDTLDGEYSYYAHLTTNTFVVTEGQYVEQGHILATVGNTGCVFSTGGGGYHVHVHVNQGSGSHEYIYAPSLPFLFDDVPSRNPDGPAPGQPVRPQFYLSQNFSSSGSTSGNNNLFGASGAVSHQQWWSATFSVPPNTPSIRITLSWPGTSNLVLYADSNGHSYGYGADVLGNPSYYLNNPQTFTISQPQAGTWTIWVLGWIVPSGTQGFNVAVTD